VGLKLNGKYQLVYVDDVKVLGNNIYTIKKITETLLGYSNEVGLEVNTQKTEVCVANSSLECRAKS
jgi:hypothetical protein